MKEMTEHKKKSFSFRKEDFSRENFIEGGIIRPAILMISFVTFLVAMFLLLLGNLKWGGSLIIFSFIFNMYSIYTSFTDEPSVFRTMNLVFKLILFGAELVFFNYLLYLL